MLNIVLTGSKIADPDRANDREGWWYDGNVVHVRTDISQRRYKLPKGASVVTIQRLGDGRSTLIMGGYSKASVSITGPTEDIRTMREHVL